MSTRSFFLRPVGTFDSTPRRGEKLFAMAIPRDALPRTITIDWTFGGTWGLACVIKRDTPAVCTENLNPHIMVMKSAQDRV
jgi:hypothetical protein